MMRALAILIPLVGLSACAIEPRKGPPAPVVRVTPRAPLAQPAPKAEQPVAEPAKQKQETQVYAYRDPASQPAPEAVTPATETPSASSAAAAASGEVAAVRSSPAAASASAPAKPVAPPQSRTNVDRSVAVEAPVAAKPEPKPEPKPSGSVALPPPEQQVAMAAPPAAPPPQSAVTTPSLPPAADALARQAEQQRQSGDYAGAAASLERSLRIAPSEAYLWNRLARVRLEQGQVSQAGNLASRSNNLAVSSSGIKSDNWRIIAEARRRAGDTTGASEAEQRANGG